MRHVTVFNPGMMLRFGGHVWTDVHPPLTRGGGVTMLRSLCSMTRAEDGRKG